MAAYSSTQSGPFDDTSTWGGSGYPSANGDTFTINYGHAVTLNAAIQPTNGLGDSTIYGKLAIEDGGTLRMDGRLYIYGNNSGTGPFADGDSNTGSELNMGPGATIEIKGDNSAQHGIWVRIYRFADVILEGSVKNHTTTLSSATSIGATSLSVGNASGFAVGDWVSVYVSDHDYRLSPDEGFIVHEISSNTIYFRQFVTPTAVISSVSSNKITVDNSKVFRIGYKLIFGTGANRNIKTITDINYNTHEITLDSTVTGSVSGETVYQTGLDKPHIVNSKVAKVASTLTADYSSGATTINVGSVGDIAVGDNILLEQNDPSITGWDYDCKYSVTAKSGNNLTISPGLRYAHKSGGKVVNLTRDCVIKAVDTSSSTRVFFYREYNTGTDSYYRQTNFKNVLFQGLGRNTSSTYYGGLMIAGRNSFYIDGSSDNRYNRASAVEACVYDSPNYRSSYSGISVRDAYRMQFRNNVSYNAWYGYWFWSSQYGHKTANNYVQRMTAGGINFETFYETYYQSLEYNNVNRVADRSYLIGHITSNPGRIRHNVGKYTTDCFYYIYNNGGAPLGDRWYHDYYIYSPYIHSRTSRATVVDSYFGNAWNTLGPTSSDQKYSYVHFDGTGDNYLDRGPVDNVLTSIENNFEIDALLEWAPWAVREWDNDQKVWFQRASGNNGSYAGFGEKIYVPANTTVYLSLEAKMVSGFSGTRPYLIATAATDTLHYGRYQTTTSDSALTQPTAIPSYGFWQSSQFTSTSDSSWERRTITVNPVSKSYFLQAMVITTSTNASEGFYVRDFEIAMDQPSRIPRTQGVDAMSQRGTVKIRQNGNVAKRRLGGRI